MKYFTIYEYQDNFLKEKKVNLLEKEDLLQCSEN